MERRELLSRVGAVLTAGSLGGCLDRYDDIAGGDGEGTAHSTTDEGSDADRQTTESGRPALTDQSFELTDSGCGEPRSEATVTFRDGGSSVVVEGTIPGSNNCYVAKLADAGYDSETGAFEVTVASTQREGAEVCAQCIVEIEYQAGFTFAGDGPETVRVVHQAMDGTETVATAESG